MRRFRASAWVMMFMFLSAAAVQAETFEVTKEADTADNFCNADCSLREAIIDAHEILTLDTHEITLPAGNYLLTREGPENDISLYNDLDVAVDIRIVGAGAAITTIDAQSIDRVFDVHGATLTIVGATITGGGPFVTGGPSGGGIRVASGSLYLTRCVVTGNRVDGSLGALGGGILGGGDLVSISDSTITNNSVTSNYARGGGIFISGGAPGISSELIILDSVVSNNTANGLNSSGGGIGIGTEIVIGNPLSIVDGKLTMVRCTVNGNHAAGGGGGVFLHAPSSGYSTVDEVFETTISGNSADGGGGVFNGKPIELTNTTLSGNTATNGGAVFTGGDMTIIHGTLSDNTATNGPAIYNVGVLTSGNSIFDGACTGAGVTTSLGGNLESPGMSCGLVGATSDRINVSSGDLALLPLADNGGKTLTHALSASSLAIDDAVNSTCVASPWDQRGVPRPIDGNNDGFSECDKGAFEFDSIFADGFESGDTGKWSGAVP